MAAFALRFDELKAGTRLPSPPGLAAAIVRALAQPGVQIADLAILAQADAATAGRVLKLANSAWAGRPTASIPEAIRRLGVEASRTAILDFSVVDKSVIASSAFDHGCYWSLTYGRASAARALAARINTVCPDEAFACGLIARVGELALATVYPAECAKLLNDAASQNGSGDRLTAEKGRFGITSFQLSAALLSDWRLPSFFVDAVLKMADGAEGALSSPSRLNQLADILKAAESIALSCIEPLDPMIARRPQAALSFRHPEISSQEFGRLCDAVRTEWREWTKLTQPASSSTTPVAKEPFETPQRPVPLAPPLEVLVVEDNPAQRRMICNVIGSAGYRVLSSENGEAALRMALEHQPDVVLSDCQMPRMDGLQLCSALRQAKIGQKVYFILIAGDGDDEILIQAFERGVDDFVAKPLSPRVLIARMKAAQRLICVEAQVRDERAKLRELAADLADANRKLEAASMTDFLTGLPNRRFFTQQLEQHWSAAVRRDRNLACLLLDIDHFKSINDRYGHAIGDQALKALGAAFRQDKRQEDIICRYGGEEFAVLLPESDAEIAYTVAERLRSAAEREVFPRLPMLSAPITVSVGLAFRTSRTTNASELVDWADQELYRAKAEGRNRTCVMQYSEANSAVECAATVD